MGWIRKSLSLGLGVTGLPGVVQYRSDTERGTRQVALLRQDEYRRHQELMALQANAQAAELRAANQQLTRAQSAPSLIQQFSPAPLKSETQSDLLAQIERLHALHLAGVLTKEEFEAEKVARMNQISSL